jgi:hypothetical protein
LLFFAPLVLHPDHLLYSDHSDFLALELPGVQFQAHAYRTTGELPRWCPYSFAGRTFASMPYPPLLFVLTDAMPESAFGPLLSWMVVVHLVLAGVAMFVYARGQGLGEVGAFVAGCGFMFGGAWLLHILDGGHFFVSLAWLPFVLLYLERAIRERSLTAATFAAVFYGLLVWGLHPQISFYAGLLIALWALGTALQEAGYLDGAGVTSARRTARGLALCVGFGLWTAGLGVALAGIQLLPAFASAEGSTRAGGVSASDLLGLSRLTLFNLVGPSLQDQPRWEECGGLGLVVLCLAVVAPVLSASKQVRYRAAVCGLLILFGLGGALVVQGLPGFSLFRQPARMFVIVGFPVAYLAGAAVDALLTRPDLLPETRQVSRFVLMVVSTVVGMLLWAWTAQLRLDGRTLQARPYWFALAFTLPATFWLLGQSRLPKPALAGAWIAVVLIDLWSLVWPQVQTRPEAEVFPSGASVAYLVEHRGSLDRVLDVDQRPDRGTTLADEDNPDPARPTQCSPLGRGAPLAFSLGLQPLRGYSPIDIARYKMFLQFIGDSDQPLVALRDHLAFPIVCNVTVRNASLLNLLGTRWLLMPSDMPAPPDWRKVLEEPSPRAFDVTSGGMRALAAYTLYENPAALPRAFVTPAAAALDEADALAQLKATDFRKTALLEGSFPALTAPADNTAARLATVTRYTPNEVVVHCDAGPPGYLVLTDPWYPGWECHINGTPTQIYRADYAFRGVALPAEACDVVFRFAPASYARGTWLTGAAFAVVAILLLRDIVRRRRTPSATKNLN